MGDNTSWRLSLQSRELRLLQLLGWWKTPRTKSSPKLGESNNSHLVLGISIEQGISLCSFPQGDNMTHRQQLLKYFASKKEGKATDIVAFTKLNRSAVYNGLTLMKKEGIVSNDDGMWILKQAAQPKELKPVAVKKKARTPFRDQQTQSMVPNGGCPKEMKSLTPGLKELIACMRENQTCEVTVNILGDEVLVKAREVPKEKSWRL